MYRTWLIPYLEGTLDAERRRQLEARLPDDPELAAELNALRRTLPRLHQSAALLRQAEAAPPMGPLWPRLRERLDAPPARPTRGPFFWWAGGLCTAGAVAAAALTLWTGRTSPSHDTQRITQVSRSAPQVMSLRNNATGTQMAVKLHRRAVHVATIERLTKPHTALQPLLVAGRPVPSAKPPLAGKLPMPVAPPFRMAENDLDVGEALTDPLAAPTHSPQYTVSSRRQSQAGHMAAGAHHLLSTDTAPAPALDRWAKLPHDTENGIHVESRMARNGVVAPAASPSVPLSQSLSTEAGTTAPGDATTNTPAPAPAPAPAIPPAAEVAIPQMQALAGTARAGNTSEPSLLQRLERTVARPLYGTEEGEQTRQRLLQDAQQAGTLDALAARLEQAPVDAARAAAQEVTIGRMLAAIYETDGDTDRALSERRHVVLSSVADAEDWFELAQTEARLGNTASAQRAYAQALRAGGSPLSAAHRAVARQNLP